MSSPVTSTTVAAVDAPAAAVDSIVSKVQKHLDAMKAKNAKLAEDNAKLRAALAEAKSSNSRIRRIPRAKKDAPAV